MLARLMVGLGWFGGFTRGRERHYKREAERIGRLGVGSGSAGWGVWNRAGSELARVYARAQIKQHQAPRSFTILVIR